jgi:hypothetical protein
VEGLRPAKLLLPFLALLLALLPSRVAAFSLSPRVNYLVTMLPFDICAADFNNNGFIDIATADGGGNQVSILPGNGNGTFQPYVSVSVAPDGPRGMICADVNDDGKKDIIVANAMAANIDVLYGNGNFTFAAPVKYTVGSNPRYMAYADLNGDGREDLVVPADNDNNVTVLYGNATGGFTGSTVLPNVTRATAVAVANFDGVNGLDLAVIGTGNSNSVLHLFFNDGTGHFGAPTDYATALNPQDIAAADFNGDGKPDVAVTGHNSNMVGVHLHSGSGAVLQPRVDYYAGYTPVGLKAADLDGDARKDLVIADGIGNTIAVLLGKGDGTFQNTMTFPSEIGSASVTTADFDGDGDLDIAVANQETERTASVFINGTLEVPTLSEAGFAALVAGLMGAALLKLRRR